MSKQSVITSPQMRFNENKLYAFSKVYTLHKPKRAEVCVSAEARYKLWINGTLAVFGPYKGTPNEKYYDRVDISSYLQEGSNAIYAEVLQLTHPDDLSKHTFMTSVFRNGNMGFALWGEAEDETGVIELFTDESWDCCALDDISFLVPDYAYYGGIGEKKTANYARRWGKAVVLREIQDLEQFGLFYGETRGWCFHKVDMPKQRYEKEIPLTPNSCGHFDAGKLVTGFVRIKARGTGTIRLTYAESYVFHENGKEVKRNRADAAGEICGDYDVLEVKGTLSYETFWFRAFRFIKTECEGDVQLESLAYAGTGYPLEVSDEYDFGNEADNRLWAISLNTLKNCMHETFEDCPYYEQLQYAMDTYLQIVFQLQLSGDCRMVKRAIHFFAQSCYPGGICHSRYPSVTRQYITGFSLFFVWMLDVLERKCGEHIFIKKYLGALDTVIQSFEEFKGEDGLIQMNHYWNFMDWTSAWTETHGVPFCDFGEALTVYNMMYMDALNVAARLNRLYGRTCIAKEYSNNAAFIKNVIQEKCYDVEAAFYKDTNKRKNFSQHSQVWAVLSGLVMGENARQLLCRAEKLEVKCGAAYAYFVLRAYEKANIYELSETMMDRYYSLLEQDCTTIPETFEDPRSECHAWGAVILYEYTAMVLGVREAENGIIEVRPYTVGRNYAKGKVHTKYGETSVSWSVTDGVFSICVDVDTDAEIRVIMPDGSVLAGIGTVKGKRG